jgi:hypothetical protein
MKNKKVTVPKIFHSTPGISSFGKIHILENIGYTFLSYGILIL